MRFISLYRRISIHYDGLTILATSVTRRFRAKGKRDSILRTYLAKRRRYRLISTSDSVTYPCAIIANERGDCTRVNEIPNPRSPISELNRAIRWRKDNNRR